MTQLTMFDEAPAFDPVITRLLARVERLALAREDHEVLAGLRDLQGEGWRRVWERRGDAFSARVATVAWMLRDHHEYGRALYPLPGGGFTGDIAEAVGARLAPLEGVGDEFGF